MYPKNGIEKGVSRTVERGPKFYSAFAMKGKKKEKWKRHKDSPSSSLGGIF